MIVNTIDGYSLVTNNKSFDDNKTPRERAKLEKALDELIINGLINARGNSGTVWGITSKGYDLIDEWNQ